MQAAEPKKMQNHFNDFRFRIELFTLCNRASIVPRTFLKYPEFVALLRVFHPRQIMNGRLEPERSQRRRSNYRGLSGA